MKKIIAIVLSVFMFCGCMSLTACGNNTDFTVGIVQLVKHDALDAATQGFKDALTVELEKEGKTVTFDYQEANNESTVCTTIVNGFVSKNYDLIMANATSALQAAANATETIPILGTSVTEYGVALGISNFNGTVGGNISGTSDLADLEKQANMITELVPDVSKVGLVYCSAEPNSKYQVDKIAEYLTAKGVASAPYVFTDSNDIATVLNGAISTCDVIYVPTDNTVASNTEAIDSICRPAGIPVITGEEGICSGCGIATLSISYYGIGEKTGKMAADILLGRADISTMAIAYDEGAVYKYNEEICTALGITVPEKYVKIEKAE